MDKLKLKEKLIAIQHRNIEELKRKIQSVSVKDGVNCDDGKEEVEISKYKRSNKLTNVYAEELIKAENDLKNLLELDFSKKDTAIPGAVISTDIFHFLIGHTMFPFDFEEKRIVGISDESSFYTNIVGKKAGESFSFSFNNYKILEIN